MLANNLTDQAWDVFSSVPRHNGVEVWRLTVRNQVNRAVSEQFVLESAALSPPRCSLQQHTEAAITKWREDVRRYHDSLPLNTAERLSETRQINASLRLLPARIEERATWEKGTSPTTRELEERARAKIRPTQHLTSTAAHKANLPASLDEDDGEDTRA